MTAGRRRRGLHAPSGEGPGSGDPAWAEEVRPAEAAVARELAALGIPVWGSGERRWHPGRYGLVFLSGRRALVLPVLDGEVSLDGMAAAKCDYLLLAGPPEEEGRRTAAGFVWWFEAGGRGLAGTTPCRDLRPRPLEELPEPSLRPARYFAAMLLGSLRLLAAGDRPVPPPTDPAVTGGTSPP